VLLSFDLSGWHIQSLMAKDDSSRREISMNEWRCMKCKAAADPGM